MLGSCSAVFLTFLRRLMKQESSPLPAGGPAPEFAVVDHAGNAITSKALVGKRYILWFYPKADTPG